MSEPGNGGVAEEIEGPGGGSGPGTRRGLVVGGAVAAVLLVGGGVWAWGAWFNQGSQPADALPADTLAYVAIDLDPTGQQKVEALRTLKKFPAFEEELGFDTTDDLRKEIFEEVQEDGTCTGLDYAEDVEPWLGDRGAFAMVPGEAEPAPVFVVQVKDEAAAETGIEALVECGSEDQASSDEEGGYAIAGGWVALAETEEIAEAVLADGAEANLADDEDFQKWTGEAGDPGILTMYAAPAAGPALVEFGGAEMGDELSDEFGGGDAGQEMADLVTEVLDGFGGAAGIVRFSDGALEFEAAAAPFEGDLKQIAGLDGGGVGELVTGLPDTTAAVFGFAFPEGYASTLLDAYAPMIEQESGMSLDEAIAEAERETGLAIPEDLDTLLGEGIAVAVDGTIQSSDVMAFDPSQIPAGIRIKGDATEIEGVLDKLRTLMGPGAELLLSEADGDHVVIGTDQTYLDSVVEGGDLGDVDVFEDVVPRADDAAVVYYIHFDAENWLDNLVADFGDDELAANIEPLAALGVSSWLEDDESLRSLVRITTGD